MLDCFPFFLATTWLIGIYSLHWDSIAWLASCSSFVIIPPLTNAVIQDVGLAFICEALIAHCLEQPRGRDNMTDQVRAHNVVPGPIYQAAAYQVLWLILLSRNAGDPRYVLSRNDQVLRQILLSSVCLEYHISLIFCNNKCVPMDPEYFV